MPNNVTITADQLRIILFKTEDNNKSKVLNTFSDAQKGHSTYTFGIMQFDVGNNPAARQFLLDNHFTQEDIDALSKKPKPTLTPASAASAALILKPGSKKIQASSPTN
jgi:hypothetical protein